MTLNEAHGWVKSNVGKTFTRGGKRSYTVVRLERKQLGGAPVALVHVVNDRRLTGVIPYSDMKTMEQVGTQSK